MKRQILVIHGGNAFNSHAEYLLSLARKSVTIDGLLMRDWKKTLQERLGEGYEVILPTMPCGQNAKYFEWKIWFERIVPLLDQGAIFIGHSLGGIFLAKYLSENECSVKIRAVFLVAAPFNTPTEHPLADFVFSEDLSGLGRQAEQLVLYHSKDDVVVPYSNLLSYQRSLPDARVRLFDDRGHFHAEEFPEIIEDIRAP